jgi:hypothetical protein
VQNDVDLGFHIFLLGANDVNLRRIFEFPISLICHYDTSTSNAFSGVLAALECFSDPKIGEMWAEVCEKWLGAQGVKRI